MRARGLNTAEINMLVPADEHHPRSREVRALRFVEKNYRARKRETPIRAFYRRAAESTSTFGSLISYRD